MDQKVRDLMFESGSVQNKERSYNIVAWEYQGNLGGLKWDTGNGRVGIRAEGDGCCACEF